MASVESGLAHLDQQRALHAQAASEGLRFTRFGDTALVPPDWLIRGYLEKDALALMYGPPAAGKSFVALDIAASIAAGQPWSGAETMSGPVLYLAGEGGNGLIRRLTAWSIRHAIDPALIGVSVSNGPGRLCDLDGAAELKAAIDTYAASEGSPSLLVVDTLARSFGGGDESSNADMSAAIAALDQIRTKHRCAVLVVHHSGHHAKDRARGASALFAAVDTAIQVDQDEDKTVRVAWTKSKDTRTPDPLAFKLRASDLPVNDDRGEPLTSAVLDQVDYQAPASSSGKASSGKGGGKQQRRALEILRNLKADCETNVIASGRDASEARVEWRHWRQAMMDAGINRSSAYEMRQTLSQSGDITIDGIFVSPV